MDGRALPGYYFDSEKKKYFKILPSHAAPRGSKYSKESIRKEKRESKIRKRKQRHDEAVKRERVQRTAFAKNSFYGGIGLLQELGHYTSRAARQNCWAGAYVQSLNRYPRCVAGDLENVNHTSIPAFVYDSASGGILWAQYYTGHDVSRLMSSARAPADYIKQRSETICIRSGTGGQITSASIASKRAVLITKQSRLSIDIMDLTPVLDRATGEPMTSRPPEINCFISCGTKEESSCWSSAADPTSTEVEFVVGLSDRATLLTPNHPAIFTQELRTGTDVFATDWLQPGVCALGLRNGLVTLWDRRAQGSAARLLHPSCVTALRRVDDSRLIVAGLENALCLYDLRMSRTEKMAPRRDVRKGNTLPDKAAQPTVPLLKYQHANEFSNPLGLDVCAELGLVAAGTDNGQIWFHALYSGELIGSRENRLAESDVCHPAVSLQVLVEEEGARLLSTCGSQVVEFAW